MHYEVCTVFSITRKFTINEETSEGALVQNLFQSKLLSKSG